MSEYNNLGAVYDSGHSTIIKMDIDKGNNNVQVLDGVHEES